MSFTVDHHYFGPSSYRKARSASVLSSGFHSQRRRLTYSQPSTVDSVDTFNGDMTRRSEKEILQALNDRFAGYIDKVRNLEMHNRNLEAEAEALRQNQTGRASVGEHYEQELSDLRALLQQLCGERARAVLEHEHLEEDIQHVRARLEDEARNREELEAAARAMKKYAEECRLARLELDKKLRAIEEESAFLKKNHDEEVSELLAQIQGGQVNFDVRESTKADITIALKEIRTQLDNHASNRAMHTEDWFKVRMEHLSEAAKSNQDAIRATQDEIADYRRQLQSRTIELETIRGTKDSLERQCMESEDRHQDELHSLQETINQLDSELKSTKWEMASQLKDYQELLNVKMALDIEIAAYRKLLEGEETRFLSGGGPYCYLDGRISGLIKLKGEDKSDRVIVEEQTDETQVTEVTEDADDDEEDNKEEEGEEEGEEGGEEGGEEEGEEGGEEEGEEEGEKTKDDEQDKKEESDKEGENKDEENKSKSPSESPKSPQKSPLPKSPEVKSPSGDEFKTPDPIKSPEKEKLPKDSPKKEKKEEKPPVKDDKKTKEQPAKDDKKSNEKEAESKKEKESKGDQKKDDPSKPAVLTKAEAKEEKPAAQKSEKQEPKKEDMKPEVKKDEKKEKDYDKDAKQGAKTEKAEKSSSTDSKK